MKTPSLNQPPLIPSRKTFYVQNLSEGTNLLIKSNALTNTATPVAFISPDLNPNSKNTKLLKEVTSSMDHALQQQRQYTQNYIPSTFSLTKLNLSEDPSIRKVRLPTPQALRPLSSGGVNTTNNDQLNENQQRESKSSRPLTSNQLNTAKRKNQTARLIVNAQDYTQKPPKPQNLILPNGKGMAMAKLQSIKRIVSQAIKQSDDNKENIHTNTQFSTLSKDPLVKQADKAYHKYLHQNQLMAGEVTLKKQNAASTTGNINTFINDLTSKTNLLQEKHDKVISRGQRFEKAAKQNHTYDEMPHQVQKDNFIYRTQSSNNINLPTENLKPQTTKAADEPNLSQFLTKRNSIHDYEIGQKLGEGAYAIVRSCRHKASNSKIAMKIYDKLKLSDPVKKRSVSREISLLQKLDHPNIVKFYESIDTHKTINLVMEHVKGKSLYAYLKARRWRRIDEKEAKVIFKQIVEGVQYLHKQNVAHRDLKPDNILIDEKMNSNHQIAPNVKLIDFGFSVVCDRKLKTFCGTPSYMSPEIVTKKEYDGKAVDLWALGIILFNMIYGRCPFRAENERDLYRKIARGQFAFPDEVYPNQDEFQGIKVSSQLKNLVKKILVVQGDQRPSCSDIINHEWFKS